MTSPTGAFFQGKLLETTQYLPKPACFYTARCQAAQTKLGTPESMLNTLLGGNSWDFFSVGFSIQNQ